MKVPLLDNYILALKDRIKLSRAEELKYKHIADTQEQELWLLESMQDKLASTKEK